jgi:hypothetical protein
MLHRYKLQHMKIFYEAVSNTQYFRGQFCSSLHAGIMVKNVNEPHPAVLVIVQTTEAVSCLKTTKSNLLHRTTCFDIFCVILRFIIGL